MGNRTSANPGTEGSPRRMRGAMGVDEFLLLHHAVQYHLLGTDHVGEKIKPSTTITQESFTQFFGLRYDPEFASDFYKFTSASAGGPGGTTVTFKALTTAISHLCTGLVADRAAFAFKLFSRGEESVDRAGAARLVSTLFTMYSLLGCDSRVAEGGEGGGAAAADPDAAAAEGAEGTKDPAAASAAAALPHLVASLQAVAGEGDSVSVGAFQAWVSNNCVCAGDILATHFHCLFLETPEAEDEQPRDLLRRPHLSAPTHLLPPADVLALSLVSHRMQRNWEQLYSSFSDGLSFNRLNYGIGGYAGPMLFVVRSEDGQTFGAFAGEGVTESDAFQGNPLSFVFSLRPNFSVLRATPTTNGHFVYYNTRGHDARHGIGFGGNHTAAAQEHRLWLNADLDQCEVREFGDCFARGRLAEPRADSTTAFDVAAIEVWGLGGEDAQIAQQRFRSDNAKMFDDMKSLKESTKKAFAADAFNQEMFMSKTFQHRSTAAGGSLE